MPSPPRSAVPVQDYLPLMGGFGVGAAVLTHLAAGRPPQRRGALELVEAGLATYFVARLVAREKLGAVVREPFVEPVDGADPADPRGNAKQAAGERGVRHAVGELVTCTRCLGPWAAAAVTYGGILAPRHARIVTRVLALAGANSLAQVAHAAGAAVADRAPAG